MISKRMILAGGPLGHLALPGVAVALIYKVDVFWGALAAIIIGAVLIWLLNLKGHLPLEAVTGVVFAATVALGFLFLPMHQAEEALIGDITKVNLFDTTLALGLGLAIFAMIARVYSTLVLINISEDIAQVQGKNVKRYNLIFLIAIALVVAMEVKIVGILLTAALLIIPAASASNFAHNLKQYTAFALIFGGMGAILGVFLHYLTNAPAGPLIILAESVFFLASLFAKKS